MAAAGEDVQDASRTGTDPADGSPTLDPVRHPAGARGPLTAIDEIQLSVPNERRFFGVVRLLVGGLAARLDLAYEQMDDLQLAVESILARGFPVGDSVSLQASVDGGRVAILVGPLRTRSLEDEPDRDGGIGLQQLLAALVDRVEIVDRTGEPWLRLEKRIPARLV